MCLHARERKKKEYDFAISRRIICELELKKNNIINSFLII